MRPILSFGLLLTVSMLLSACDGGMSRSDFAYYVIHGKSRDAAVSTSTEVEKADAAVSEASPEEKDTGSDRAALVANAPVGKTIKIAAPEDTVTTADATSEKTEPHLSVLEEYDSATGERCRRYAWFENETTQGKIETACRVSEGEAWVTLRPLSHETLSPLASMPASNVAQAFSAPVEPVEIVK